MRWHQIFVGHKRSRPFTPAVAASVSMELYICVTQRLRKNGAWQAEGRIIFEEGANVSGAAGTKSPTATEPCMIRKLQRKAPPLTNCYLIPYSKLNNSPK